MAHKLTMTGLLVFINDEDWYLCIGMCVALLYLLGILWLKPYIRKGDDRLAVLAQNEVSVANPLS